MDWKAKYARIYAEVDLDKIQQNINSLKANLKEDTRIMGVIKADGYGHGAIPIAKELEPLSCMYGFAVATAQEAVILRRAGIHKPILILGYTFPESFEKLIKEDVSLAVFREDTLVQLSEVAKKCSKKAKVHLKVDTGMSRIGILPDEKGMDFVQKALHTEGIEVEGIFTHFATADYADKTHAWEQYNTFLSFCQNAEQKFGITFPIKHCSNSAAMMEMDDANMDVVRAGIAMYGLWPSNEVSRDTIHLEPALMLKSTIVYIKEVPEGTPIGYGRSYITNSKCRVATIPAGYGDGYPRSLSNKGFVLIHGKKAPILGRVCMDQFMVDVTHIPEACENDEVILIGRDRDACITMELLDELCGRFNYELACDLGKRIPKVYLKDGRIIGTKDYFDDYE